jgi:hypothetical protein
MGKKGVYLTNYLASLDNVQKDKIIKKISKGIWETLNRCKFVDERFAWEGEESGEEKIYTPPESPMKEDCSNSLNSIRKTHLEVNGYVHFEIIKQLFVHYSVLNP